MADNVEEFRQEDLPAGWVLIDGRPIPWWYTRDGVITKYSILLGLVLLMIGFIVGSYIHARRRIRNGMAPMRYHRWLVTKPSSSVPPEGYYARGLEPAGPYNMHYMAPPPVYDPTRPPVYEEPPVHTKTAPSQWPQEQTRRPEASSDDTPAYQPPIGPPPGHPAAMTPPPPGPPPSGPRLSPV